MNIERNSFHLCVYTHKNIYIYVYKLWCHYTTHCIMLCHYQNFLFVSKIELLSFLKFS
jgi:hypothetical protein